jgi:hypothetical protein
MTQLTGDLQEYTKMLNGQADRKTPVDDTNAEINLLNSTPKKTITGDSAACYSEDKKQRFDQSFHKNKTAAVTNAIRNVDLNSVAGLENVVPSRKLSFENSRRVPDTATGTTGLEHERQRQDLVSTSNEVLG